MTIVNHMFSLFASHRENSLCYNMLQHVITTLNDYTLANIKQQTYCQLAHILLHITSQILKSPKIRANKTIQSLESIVFYSSHNAWWPYLFRGPPPAGFERPLAVDDHPLLRRLSWDAAGSGSLARRWGRHGNVVERGECAEDVLLAWAVLKGEHRICLLFCNCAKHQERVSSAVSGTNPDSAVCILYKNQNYFASAWRYETSGMSQGIPPIACFPQERSTCENRILTAKSIAPRNIIIIIVFDDILSRYSRI